MDTLRNLPFEQIALLCRICLRKDENAVEISKLDLSTIFETVLRDKLINDEDKPKTICTQCIVRLNQYYHFLDVYNKSKIALEEFLKSKQVLNHVESSNSLQANLELVKIEIEDPLNEKSQPQTKNNDSNRKSTNKPRVKCNICNMNVYSFNLLRHKKTRHDFDEEESLSEKEMKEPCDVCGKQITVRYLAKHKETQHDIKIDRKKNLKNDTGTIVCHICGLQVACKDLNKHCRIKHDQGKPAKVMCELCGRQFGNKYTLNDHVKNVHEGIRFNCHLCPGKSYTTSAYLKDHIERKHTHTKPEKTTKPKSKPSVNAKWVEVCEICGHGIPRNKPRRILLHKAFHKYNHKVMCLIPDCNITFSDTPARLQHMTNDHEKLTCDECHKDFFDQSRFQAHCEVHIWENNTDFDPDKSVCRICNQHFKSDPILADHLKKIHKLYWCLEKGCYKLFITRGSLALDRTNHKTTTKFKCQYCPREFKSEKSYSIHEKGHSKKEGFKCSICEYSFAKQNKLKIHMRTHTGEKPFQCSFCPKRFICMSTKKTHERYHTGEKPYVCQYCNRGFASRTIYNRHINYEMRTNPQAITGTQETNENN